MLVQQYDEYDNFILVPTSMEEPDDIIEDYTEMIESYGKSHEDIKECLIQFFDEITMHIKKQFYIEQALHAIQVVKETEAEIGFYNEDKDLDDED
jgi:hypothetical protein